MSSPANGSLPRAAGRAGLFMYATCRCRVVCCLLTITGGLLSGSLVLGRSETPLASKTLALVGGRILTQSDAGTVDGIVLIRDGKIAAVGRTVEIPADATKVDVTGC